METVKRKAKKDSVFKGKVNANMEKEFEAYRKTGAYLRDSITFDHNQTLISAKREIAHELFAELMAGRSYYKEKQKRLDLEVLCGNLLLHRDPTAISLNKNHWKKGRYRRVSYFLTEAIDLLADNGYIEMEKGYGHEDQEKAVRTKIWKTEKLRDRFAPIKRGEDVVIYNPVELILLRDKDGKQKDYKESRQSIRLRDSLQRINATNSKFLIQRIDSETRMAYRLQSNLHSVFNVDFKHGGRFYSSTADGYQALEREERQHIFIDGEPTIELDFSGFHPRLLYALEGKQYNEDPYVAVNDDEALRPVLKKLIFAALNCESKKEAMRPVIEFAHKDNPKYHQRLRRRGLSVKDDLIPALLKAHKPIKKYFFTGEGLRVANTDSKIALKVLTHFTDKGIPILCIHDSFIVQKRYKRELRDTMKRAYRTVTKGFECRVELR
jgi:hypothetical protein